MKKIFVIVNYNSSYCKKWKMNDTLDEEIDNGCLNKESDINSTQDKMSDWSCGSLIYYKMD